MACLGDQLGMEFSREEIAECRGRNGLLSLELELSRVCNLRCVYCYASSGIPLENELSFSEITDAVEQAAGLGVKKVIILGGGEPLLYPRLFEVIDFILGKGIIVDLFTNGLTLTKDVARKLCRRGVGVVLKMNSRKPEVQDALAGKSGTHEAIVKALAALQDTGYPNERCSLGIETIICEPNYHELPDLWRWAREQSIVPYIEAMTMQGRATEHGNLEVSPEKVQAMFEELSRIDRDEFQCSWLPHPPLVASQCARHEYSCTITSIGEVHPCPGVSLSTGNIRENSLAEIVCSSTVIRDLRDIRNTIKGKCASCEIKNECYGCRGHAYQVTGDYLAEDSLCWLKKSAEKHN
jgi:radical SAM protein with 4Fe4S-binding SPASM domain